MKIASERIKGTRIVQLFPDGTVGLTDMEVLGELCRFLVDWDPSFLRGLLRELQVWDHENRWGHNSHWDPPDNDDLSDAEVLGRIITYLRAWAYKDMRDLLKELLLVARRSPRETA